MRKMVLTLFILIGVLILSGCKPVDPVEVDCTLNPNHEDCLALDDCELDPTLPICNIVYTFEDSYELLDFENDEVDEFEDVFYLMNAIVNYSSSLFDVRKDYNFYNFYSSRVESDSGLLRGELVGYNHYPDDVLLAGIDLLNITISGEVSHFSIITPDEVFSEGVEAETELSEDYIGRSNIFVNDDGFHYAYEAERIDTPGVLVSYYEMTLLIVDNERLVFELVNYTDISDEGFDYTYIVYDSEVGYIVKDLRFYNENFVYYENKVDLNEGTAETKEINIGGYRTYKYSFFDVDEGIAYQKTMRQSQIGEFFITDKVSFFDGLFEVVSLTKSFELVDTGHIPTDYILNYNILYLNDWDIVYGDYIVKNNNEVAFVTTKDLYSVSQLYMDVEQVFGYLPTENEFLTPYTDITFDEVAYSDLVYEMNRIYTMDNPVTYWNNVATVLDVEYDLRTDLVDLFSSDLPQVAYNNLVEHLITEDIVFEGEDALIDMIDCNVEPEHDLCPDN